MSTFILICIAGASKKRRVENILEKYIDDIKHERESIQKERDEERKREKKKRSKIWRKEERAWKNA